MPRPLRPIADGLIYHVINRGNNRQTVFENDGDYAAFLKAIADLKERKPFDLYGYCLMGNHIHMLVFACHGLGRSDPLLDPVAGYDALASYPAARQRRWSAYVQGTPEEAELAAIRRSSETGLPYGEKAWVDRLCRKLKLDLTIRPPGRPRKDANARN